MPGYVFIQIRGVEKAARIRGDQVDRETSVLRVLKNGRPVAEFKDADVQGWWLDDGDLSMQ